MTTETPAVRTGNRRYREGVVQMQRGNENEDGTSDVININGSGHSLVCGTWNVRTLHKAGKFDNAIQELNAYKLDLLGMGEVRWTGSGKTEKE